YAARRRNGPPPPDHRPHPTSSTAQAHLPGSWMRSIRFMITAEASSPLRNSLVARLSRVRDPTFVGCHDLRRIRAELLASRGRPTTNGGSHSPFLVPFSTSVPAAL